MKKLPYFGLSICACVAMCFCTMSFSSVKADETPATISINSANEFFNLFNNNVDKDQKFVLNADIALNENETIMLKERNIENVEFDGNGHTITTSFPLFNVVGEGAVIKNLNVIAAKNFEYTVDISTISNFGLVACDVKGGRVFNVSASCEVMSNLATDAEKKNNRYNVLNLSFKGHANVGGMFGQARFGAVIHNCYVQTYLNVTQNSLDAGSTIVGGFVGNVENAIIKNCYATPVYSKELVKVNYPNDYSYPSYIIGGFAGSVNDDIQSCVNVFTGGYLPTPAEQINRFVGKVFGKVSENITNTKDLLKISKCYSYNESNMIDLCGMKSDKSNIDVLKILEDDIKSIKTFDHKAKIGQDYVWNLDDEWDVDQTWCKKSVVSKQETTFGEWDAVEKWKNQNYEFPVLQIFQSFSIMFINSSNSVGVSVDFVNEEGQSLGKNPLEENYFVYGTTVSLKIDITEEYFPYKRIEALKFKNVSQTDVEIDGETSVVVPIVITKSTSGVYEATSKDIVYYLNVKSEDVNKGYVSYTDLNYPLSQDTLSPISLNRDLSFTANSTISYAFEKWVWLDENGEEAGDLFTGVISENEDENHLAQKIMKIKFGDKEHIDNNFVHLFLKMEEGNLIENNNIPYKEEDGKIIFTIQAKFSPNIQKMQVYVNAPSGFCKVFIGGNECEGDPSEGMLFSQDVTVGIFVTAKVEIGEGYKFLRWSCNDYDINELIDKNSDVKSTEIYVKMPNRDKNQSPITLNAEVEKIETKKVDLTWLWFTLGGVGVAGVITLIVCVAVAKRKNESFVRYY